MTALHNRRDTILNDLDALRRERDGMWAMYAQIDDCDAYGERWDVMDALADAAAALTDRLVWLRMDADDVEARMPGERAWEPMVL